MPAMKAAKVKRTAQKKVSSKAKQGKKPAKAKQAATKRQLPPTLNRHLPKVDFLYHLGFASNDPVVARFKDVKLICMHGAAVRARKFAQSVATRLNIKGKIEPIGKTDRGELYQVGPVVSMTHGMGCPSLLIFLHEVAKLMHHAGNDDYEVVRMGTCGGVGVEPGSVVLTTEALNEALQNKFERIELGKRCRYPAKADMDLVERLALCAEELGARVKAAKGKANVSRPVKPMKGGAGGRWDAVMGKTMCSHDFYEGQGRLDGIFETWYTDKQKLAFLAKAAALEVRNIEMESAGALYFWQKLGRPCAVIASALLNRLNGDQVTTPPAVLGEWTERSQAIVFAYIDKLVQ